jgi:hypothetical protein
MSANMVCVVFSNQGVNLWQVNLVTIPLVQGTATYSVPASTVVILDAYVSTTYGGSGQTIDRIILPVSRTEYASYANKEQQGFPTTFWHNRQLTPVVTFWPVPDGTQTSVNLYVLTQTQDAALTNGQTLDMPYLWLSAFADALALKLAVIWAPDRVVTLSTLADKSYAIAAETNVEYSQFYVSPQLNTYYKA